MNADRLVIFRTALSDAMTEIRAKDRTFYTWGADSTPVSVAARLVISVETRGSIRAINLSDRSRRIIARVLGIKNTLASFDAYLKG